MICLSLPHTPHGTQQPLAYSSYLKLLPWTICHHALCVWKCCALVVVRKSTVRDREICCHWQRQGKIKGLYIFFPTDLLMYNWRISFMLAILLTKAPLAYDDDDDWQFWMCPLTPDKHGWPLARISPNSCIIYAHYWLLCHMSQWRILWLTCNWTAVKRRWHKKALGVTYTSIKLS